MKVRGSISDVLAGKADWAVAQADCLQLLPMLPDGAVDHVITDPPYRDGIAGKAVAFNGFHSRQFIKKDRAFGYDLISDDERAKIAFEIARMPRRWCLVWTDVESVSEWRSRLSGPVEHIRTGAWVKTNAQPQFSGDRPAVGFEACEISHVPGKKRWNGGGHPAVWTGISPINGPTGDERHHPTPKPVWLMSAQVEQFTDPGELVLDPFAGSGTTGVACLRLGRRFIGIEKDEKYHAVAVDRLTAESRGQSLREFRAGQLSLLADGGA